MHANMKRLALQLSLVSMTALAVPAVATGQASTDAVDLRLVTALEQQDTQAARALLAEGVGCQHAARGWGDAVALGCPLG